MSAGKPQLVEIAPPLPQHVEAERSILGAIILDNEVFHVAAAIVGPADFSLRQNQIIFSCMGTLAEHGKPIGTVALVEELQSLGEFEKAGGIYVSTLADGLPRSSNVRYYAGVVREKAVLRNLARAAEDLRERALGPGADLLDVLPFVENINGIVAPVRGTTTEAIPIPDLPESALDGKLGDICQRRLPGLPLSYAWTALVAVAGTLVPPSLPLRTNLYACLVGPTHSGKSSAIDQAIAALGVIPPALQKTFAGSAEGLLQKLSDANGSARLVFPDELGHLLSKAKIDNASFPFILNRAFYDTEFDITAARGRQILVNCVLGIVGGVVDENFESSFGSATTGGLHDRFIFGLCPRPSVYQYRPFEGAAEESEPCAVTVARDVWEVRDDWERTIPGVNGRSAEKALRVAAVCAAFSGQSILSAKQLGPARAFVEYQARIAGALAPNPGENPDARCAHAVLTALGDSDWVGKRELGRKIHANRFGPSVFERAIMSLQASGEIYVDKCKPAKIRRAM